MASGIVTVAVYDVLVLPLWLLMTHRIPLPADVLGKWITRCGVIENIREQLFVLTADMQKNGLTLASLSRRSLPLSRLYSVCSLFNVGKKNFCVDIIFFQVLSDHNQVTCLKHVFCDYFSWSAIHLGSHMPQVVPHALFTQSLP